jgi:DNA-binding NarL/FixJ family response regulator
MSAPVRVLVVDDSLPFREAARELIQSTAGFEWIGEAASGEDGVTQAALLAPDLVLMDVRMPGIGGLEAAGRIGTQVGSSIVVLITGDELDADLVAGAAAAVLPKHRLNHASLRRLWHMRLVAAHESRDCA